MVIGSFSNACWSLLGEVQSYHRFNVLTWSFLSWAITRACTAAKVLLYLHLYLSLVIGVDERDGHGCLKTPSPCPLALIRGLQKPITLSHCDSSRGRNIVQKRRTQDVLLLQHVLWYPVANAMPTFRGRGGSFCAIPPWGWEPTASNSLHRTHQGKGKVPTRCSASTAR